MCTHTHIYAVVLTMSFLIITLPASPENMQILGLHPRPTELECLRAALDHLHMNKPSRGF